MGREAYRSIYGDLTALNDDSLLKEPAAGSGDDDEMFQLLIPVLIGWIHMATGILTQEPGPWCSTATTTGGC